MGCTSSRHEPDDSSNIQIENIEISLPLSKISLSFVEEIISTTPYEKIMSRNQLVSICRFLNHPLTSKEIFIFHYMKDSKEDELSTSKVFTLMALLGKGSRKRKARILFKVYSMRSQNVLLKDDVRVMVKNIVEISNEHLVRFSMIYDKGLSEYLFENYLKRLNLKKNSIISYFSALICDGKERIDLDFFKDSLQKIELNVLMKPRFIRALSLSLQDSITIKNNQYDDTHNEISTRNISLLKKHSRSTSAL